MLGPDHHFRDLPLILDDVTLSIKAGQYVALVGASGSGKSTLLRMMLAFERPQQGGVYYDSTATVDGAMRLPWMPVDAVHVAGR